jgi:putative DNA primase/helicase
MHRPVRQTIQREKGPNVHEMLLQEEGAGILNWCIEGARKLLRDIGETGDIVMSPAQCARVETLLDESDSLTLFVEQKIDRNKYMDLSVQEITQAYMGFCDERHWNSLGTKDIPQKLGDLMLRKFQVGKSHDIKREEKHVRGFHGVRLKLPTDE